MKKVLCALLACVFANISQAQWQPDLRLTNDPGWSTTSFNNAWCVASSGDFVHVIWSDDRDGSKEIFYKRSTDGGSSWQADEQLTNTNASMDFPSIAAYGSDVYAVWFDNRDFNKDIYFKHSSDNGLTWDADVQLTTDAAQSVYPSLSVYESLVNVVWGEGRDGNWEIYYKRSTNKGITWDPDTRLTNNSSDSFNPSVSVTGSNVNVVWYDFRNGNGEIYYKRSSDSGVNWEPDIRLTNNSGSSIAPSISVSNSYVHIVWYDDSDGNFKIYYVRSTDTGINWDQDTCITYSLNFSYIPSITVSGSAVHVVWASGDPPLNREIYYKRSTDEGASWEQEIRLTNATAESWHPSVSITDSILHVVWRDGRDGNYEIYYKRNTNANISAVEDDQTYIPRHFSLEQNYPNPFNPSTKIKYSIPFVETHRDASLLVTLKVYDVLGNEIETLVNEEKPAGNYEITWNAVNLPSGVYFYQLKAGDFIKTKKMILLK